MDNPVKRGRGRPAKPPEEKRALIQGIKIHPEVARRIDWIAERLDVSKGKLVEQLINDRYHALGGEGEDPK
jgi:hypothetical protein